MTTFDEREKAFENKYFHEEELKFRIISRRRKMLGLWAAEQMHMSEEDSLKYAIDIVRKGVELNEDNALIQQTLSDMKEAGLKIEESRVREKMDELHKIADAHILKQYTKSDYR